MKHRIESLVYLVICLLGSSLLGPSLLGQATVREEKLLDSTNASQPPANVGRSPRDNLLVYRRNSDSRTSSFFPVMSIADWQFRRSEIMTGVKEIMGELPGPEKKCVLAMELIEEVDCGSYVRRLITYASEPGSRVPAYLLIPKEVMGDSGKRTPAVLCLHGTEDTVGHGIVVGLGQQPNRQYARELAERGYVVLAPSYPLLAQYQPDVIGLGWASGTLKAVWDNMRGLDLLQSLPYVESDSLAAIGQSLGGHNSVFTGVWDERLKVIISSCGLDSFLDYYSGNEQVWMPERGWTQTRYMPRLANYRGRLDEIPFDFHELVASLAPRHVLIIAPLKDDNFQSSSVDRIIQAARPVFELYGCADHLQVEHPNCGHDFPDEMREMAYQLLDRVLLLQKP